MPDLTVVLALLALIAIAEASPYVRLPLGLLLAIAMLAYDLELLPVALIGAAGVILARLSLAMNARRSRDRLGGTSSEARARREAMQRHLSGSPAYVRATFLLAAMPFMPANFIFPMLGAMRAPLWPALLGTLVGRTPVLAFTAAIFAWIGRAVSENDNQAAFTLGFVAMLMLVYRTVSLIDWQYRNETGRFRLRDPDEQAARIAAMFGGPMAGGPGAAGPGFPPRDPGSDDDEFIEGEILGEEHDDEDDDEPPASLPRGDE